MATFDAMGIIATNLPDTLDFYRLVGLNISPTEESHVEVEVTDGFRLMFDAPWGQRYATVLDPDRNPVDLYCSLDR